MKAIGVVRLVFPSGFVLDLEDVLCIPSMRLGFWKQIEQHLLMRCMSLSLLVKIVSKQR